MKKGWFVNREKQRVSNRNPKTLFDVIVEVDLALRNRSVRGLVALRSKTRKLDVPVYQIEKVDNLIESAIMVLTGK